MANNKALYGAIGGLYGIGKASEYLDKNPAAKSAVKQSVAAGKTIIRSVPKKIIALSQAAKEWS